MTKKYHIQYYDGANLISNFVRTGTQKEMLEQAQSDLRYYITYEKKTLSMEVFKDTIYFTVQ